MRKTALITILTILAIMITGCTSDSGSAVKRLTVINMRTNKPMIEVVASFREVYDSTENRLTVICEIGDGQYRNHTIGLNDWTTYIIEDIRDSGLSKYHYEVNYPEIIVPETFND